MISAHWMLWKQGGGTKKSIKRLTKVGWWVASHCLQASATERLPLSGPLLTAAAVDSSSAAAAAPRAGTSVGGHPELPLSAGLAKRARRSAVIALRSAMALPLQMAPVSSIHLLTAVCMPCTSVSKWSYASTSRLLSQSA